MEIQATPFSGKKLKLKLASVISSEAVIVICDQLSDSREWNQVYFIQDINKGQSYSFSVFVTLFAKM